MSAECRGINYALRFREGTLHIRARPLREKTSAIGMDKVKSIELLRKSVMPPAVIGAVCLSLVFVLGIAEEWWIPIVPSAFRSILQFLGVGAAVFCLVVLVCRWFFVNIILKPVDASPTTVRMVPTGSARRFVMIIQNQTPPTEMT